jgi:glycosyltransferase involved in cell wall biosynthesis
MSSPADARAHLHFVQSLEPLQGGGLGRAALDLHLNMARSGIRSSLIATGATDKQSGHPGVTEARRTLLEKLYWSPRLPSLGAQNISAQTIVHGHGFFVAPNWRLGGLARRRGAHLVYHAHGFFEPYSLSRSRWKKAIARFLFENANFHYASLWRALTVREADQIRGIGVSAPIIVAPNGVDTEFIRLAENCPAPKQQEKICLFLGRLHPKKGLALLIPAWASLGKLRSGWKLRIVGPDELGHRAEVKQMAQELGVDDSVEFGDAVSGLEKIQVLKSASLFVMPSFSEGFSVAILEAMTCEIPVIATHACNFPELTAAGAGWNCDSTVEGVASALGQAMGADEREIKQRGALGLALIKEKYLWPAIVSLIVDACEEHCQKPTLPRG